MMNILKAQYPNDKKRGKENNTYLLEKGKIVVTSGQVSCVAIDGEIVPARANACQWRRVVSMESWMVMAESRLNTVES